MWSIKKSIFEAKVTSAGAHDRSVKISYLYDIELDSDRWKRREDVAEHDHAVRFEGTPRLQREFDRDFSSFGAMPKVELVGVFPKLGHVSPCLTHQPYRRSIAMFSSCDTQ